MPVRFRPWQLAALAIVLCAIALGVALYFRLRTPATVAELLAYMPPAESAVTFYADVAALRRSGVLDLLAGSRVAEEPEYKAFVLGTGFDYRRDLDTVLASFQEKDSYFLVRGRFNWKALRDYVYRQGGACLNAICHAPATRPERHISFFALRSDLMAMAVSPGRFAARNLSSRKDRHTPEGIPAQPIWVMAPGTALKGVEGLPPGTRLFAQVLENAEALTVALGPDGQRFEVVMDVTCRTEQDALLLKLQLEKVTDMLRRLIQREKQTPNPRDLSGVLTAGAFKRVDRRVSARWPVEKPFLEALAGGNL